MSPVSVASTSSVPSLQPSASYSITMRVRQRQLPGAFARVAGAIGETGAMLGATDLVRAEGGEVVRDVTVACVDAAHGDAVVEAVGSLEGLVVERVSDRTFLMHLGGKIEVNATIPVKTRDDLSMAYTPGAARVSMAIHEDTDSMFADDQGQHGGGDLRREARRPSQGRPSWAPALRAWPVPRSCWTTVCAT